MEPSDTSLLVRQLTMRQRKKNGAFFRRFDAKHPELTKKRQGMVSIDRALNCSQEMARNHIDK